MKKVLVTIYDKVAQRINDPFISDNFETAKRTVRQAILNSDGLRAMAPDLELLQLGTIDFTDGMINDTSFVQPVPIVDLLNDVIVTSADISAETK